MTVLSLELAKVVGKLADDSWAQVHNFLPENDPLKESRGQLLAAIGLTRLSRDLDLPSAGKEVISRLHEEYFGQTEEGAFGQLQWSVDRVVNEALGEADLEIASIAVREERLTAAIAGGGMLLLRRLGKTVKILDCQSPMVSTASGFLKAGDILILGTGEFFRILPGSVLAAALVQESIADMAEALTLAIHSQSSGGASAIIAKVVEESPEPLVIGESAPAAVAEPSRPKQFFLKSFIQTAGSFFGRISRIKRKREINLPTITPSFGRDYGLSGQDRPGSKKTILSVLLIFLLLLIAGLFFGSRQKAKRITSAKSVLAAAEEKLRSAESLFASDRTAAAVIVTEAEGLLEKAKGFRVKLPDLDRVQNDLVTLRLKTQRKHSAEPAPFFDLALIKAGASGKGFSLLGSEAIVLDVARKSIYLINLEKKQQSVLASGEEIGEARSIYLINDRVFFSTAESIFQVIRQDKKVIPVLGLEKARGILAMEVFDNNLYLLSREMVYRVTTAGVQPWLESGLTIGEGKSLAIDGSIWLIDGQKIRRFSRGREENFKLTRLEKPFSLPAKIILSEKKVYVFDKGNNRLVVLAKSGQYLEEYNWEKAGTVDDLLVSESLKKIFLLIGSQIKSMDLYL